MSVLVTGFEPFGGESVNPSWEAVAQLAEESPHRVRAAQLPCVFDTSIPVLRREIEAHRPELVLVVGQAGGRTGLSLERTAVNVDDARIADNAGGQPIDEPVVPDGPVGYFSRLPIKACVAELRAAGIPASVSQTAGTYVCNHVFYGLMHLIATEYPDLRGGLVHVPYAPEQAVESGEPTMPIDLIACGLGIILSTSLKTPVDIAMPGGDLH
ncbi:MAG: pyroglutamyl-peptidase I [Actinocatenispora sp.]